MAGRAADERGAVIVLASLMMVGILTVVTIVVDLGNLRSVRRSVQNVVDFASLAGASHLDLSDGRAACAEAVRYLRLNTPDLPSGAAVPCGDLPPTCDPTTPVTVTDGGTAAPYAVSITHPVPNSAIADPSVPGGVRFADGTPCERLGVRVDRTNKGFFTGIVGVDSLDVHADAVARRSPWTASRIPNLWLLDPFGCNALTVDGGAEVEVGSTTIGGLVTIDSDGTASSGSSSCSGTSYTVDVSGTNSELRVIPMPPTSVNPPGEISLVAMRPLQTKCNDPAPIGNPKACDQSDVDDANWRLRPQPVRRSQRATRAIVDHIYDCKASYPNYHGIRITGCAAAGTRQAYVSTLRSGLSSGPPLGYQVWTSAGYTCDNSVPLPPALTGNWWVDCTNFKVDGGTNVNFTGGNVVFTGGVQLSGGSLRLNSANPTDTLDPSCMQSVIGECLTRSAKTAAFVYVRNGGIKATGGAALIAHNTTVVMDGGGLELGGNAPPRWSAPDEGPFVQLALWAEAGGSTKFSVNGGAGLDLEGVFFTPEASPFTLAGGSNFTPQRAQFVAYQAKITGGGTLKLAPSGSEIVRVPPPAALLIR